MSTTYDLLIVGGGKAGKSMAMAQAAAGMKVALVEEKYLGGTCINVACIPTKTLISTARLLKEAQNGAARGLANTSDARIDLAAMRDHKNGLVGALVGAHRKMFTESPMDFFEGHAEFTGPKSVCVSLVDGREEEISADNVVINLGTRPARPDIPGLWELGAWTSEDLLLLTEVPESMAIIGGGYIGVECAQLMADLGVHVTLIASGRHILPREDADIAELLTESLTNRGITIITGARATSAEGTPDAIALTLSDGSTVTAERVLVATGRIPNTDTCTIEATGVELTENGFIRVDHALRTTVDGVWAAGDVAGSPMFTHASWNDFRAIKAQLNGADADSPQARVDARLMPWTVFTTPELGRIGMNETEAAADGVNYRVAKLPTMAIPRAKTVGATEGMWKAIVDADTGRVLGATLLGHESGEVITALHMAMVGGLTYQQIRSQAIAHPTMGEGLNLLFDTLG